MPSAAQVLEFWFGAPGSAEEAERPRQWFSKAPAFDALVRERWLGACELALGGGLRPWEATPAGALALVILLDQMPRNLFRDDARAFAGDETALDVAEGAIAREFDRRLPPRWRVFLYLPLEHSESLAHQERCLSLLQGLAAEAPELASYLDWAEKHRDVIARFGRFPHRNAILGRVSTPEEEAFLSRPGSRF